MVLCLLVIGEAPHELLELRRMVELPLFPLPLILFLSPILSLQIFKFRYHIMMHTLLHTNLYFGIIYTNVVLGTANISCIDEVIKHERLVNN